MQTSFTLADWAVLAGYVLLLATAGWLSTRRGLASRDDYFLAGHHAPTWLVAISVLSTVQSAATFLGAPDSSYRGNFTYLSGVIGALLAAWIVAQVLIPRFYALGVTTVYELLETRFDAAARRAAALMYLLGRILASGARLYLAAIAVSMILFLDVDAQHIAISAFILLLFGLVFTFMGGLNSIIWSDLVQVVLYVGAALIVAIYLWSLIPLDFGQAVDALRHAPDGTDKLVLIDTSLNLSAPFGIFAVLTGVTLLNVGSSGLDQDITQRLIACRDARQGNRALHLANWVSLPVIALFLLIGALLHLYYASGSAPSGSFNGEKVTVFMHFILTELPPGLRGLVTVGVIAAAANQIAALTQAARAEAETRRGSTRAALEEALSRLRGLAEGMDEARLAQELALIAVKQDVTEELDRLEAHVAAARGLLAEPGPVGRKLDFLMQEFMREANTLCSKAQAIALTRIGLDLKTVIDQMREQVQNVE